MGAPVSGLILNYVVGSKEIAAGLNGRHSCIR